MRKLALFPVVTSILLLLTSIALSSTPDVTKAIARNVVTREDTTATAIDLQTDQAKVFGAPRIIQLNHFLPTCSNYGQISLTADGKELYFISTCDHTGDNPNLLPQIFRMGINNQDIFQLTRFSENHARLHSLKVSGDGSTIAFIDWSYDWPSCGYKGVYVIDSDGTGLHEVSGDPCDLYLSLSVSFDGQKIAYVKAEPLYVDIRNDGYVVNKDGSGRKQVFQGFHTNLVQSDLFLSGDKGKFLISSDDALFGDPAFEKRYYLMDGDGTNVQRLINVDKNLSYNSIGNILSFTGQYLIFHSRYDYVGQNASNLPNIFRINAENGVINQVTFMNQDPEGYPGGAIISGDGNKVVYQLGGIPYSPQSIVKRNSDGSHYKTIVVGNILGLHVASHDLSTIIFSSYDNLTGENPEHEGRIFAYIESSEINPTIAQTPMSGPPGTTFTQWGTDFTPNSTGLLHVQKPDGTEYPVQDQLMDGIGHFEIQYTSSWDKPMGTYTWWVVDGPTGISSNRVNYEIMQPVSVNPTIAQTPMSGPPGTTFTQWGTDFTPNSTGLLHVQKPDGTEYPEQNIPIDGTGHFEIEYTAPKDKEPGTYTWWMVDGPTGTESNQVSYEITSVGNQLPVIDRFAASLYEGNIPLQVTFYCDAIDLDGSIIEYRWDLNGDGLIDQVTNSNQAYSFFPDPGEFSPTVTVVDNEGGRTTSNPLSIKALPKFFLSIDEKPLGNRTPLILIHGNSGESEKMYGWETFINRALQDKSFNTKFKIYLFKWKSEEPNESNGRFLGQALDNTIELRNEKIIILAHSRGGLVSRYYMNTYTVKEGSYKGKKGGERIKNLVTLATPHRGSPGADQVWVTFSCYHNYNFTEATNWASFYAIYKDYFVSKDSYFYLLWDDVNNELTNDEVCWKMPLMHCEPNVFSIYSHLLELNQKESFHEKIIAFGGNEYDGKPAKIRVQNFIGKHTALSAFSRLMAEMPVIPNGYRDGDIIADHYKQFKANDGMVPLTSALFLKQGSQNIFQVEKGKLKYEEGDLEKEENGGFCQIGECIVIKDRRVDHLDFLDDKKLNSRIREKLKQLAK